MSIGHINESTRFEVDFDYDDVNCFIIHGQYDDLTYSSRIYTAEEAEALIGALQQWVKDKKDESGIP